LKKYLHTAAENDGIQELSKEKALEKIINSTSDVHTLARIITFYEIRSQFKISLKQTRIDYDKFYYPEAENLLIKHLNISIPTQYNDMLFLQPKIETENENKEKNSNIEENLTPTTQDTSSDNSTSQKETLNNPTQLQNSPFQ
jgi:hypothetical protein